MPTVVDVVPQQILTILSLSLDELEKLKAAMNICEGMPMDEEQKAAWGYFTTEFYPFIEQLIKDVKGNGVPVS